MDNNTQTNDGTAVPAVETKVARGLIADYTAFQSTMNGAIRRIAAKRRAWASEEATEFFVTLFDEYVARCQPYTIPTRTAKPSGRGRHPRFG